MAMTAMYDHEWYIVVTNETTDTQVIGHPAALAVVGETLLSMNR